MMYLCISYVYIYICIYTLYIYANIVCFSKTTLLTGALAGAASRHRTAEAEGIAGSATGHMFG